MSARTVARGAYGITVAGPVDSELLVRSPGESWPTIRVDCRRTDHDPPAPSITGDRATVRLVGGAQLVLDRHERRATFFTPEPLGEDDLAHPYLAAVGSYFAGWLGRDALHAGALAVNGSAWAVLGGKEDGKSTILAWLALTGCLIVTDDVLVVADGLALAGPRCLDLREPAARHLGLEGQAPAARSGERTRLRLPAVEPELPLRGWVCLSWSDRIELTPIRPSERLARLAAHRNATTSASDTALLELARFPAWELRRPRSWELLPELGARLLDLASR